MEPALSTISILRNKLRKKHAAKAKNATLAVSLPILSSNSRNAPSKVSSPRPFSRDISHMKDNKHPGRTAGELAQNELVQTLLQEAHSDEEHSIHNTIPERKIDTELREIVSGFMSEKTDFEDGLLAYRKYTQFVVTGLQEFYADFEGFPPMRQIDSKYICPTGRREVELLEEWLGSMFTDYVVNAQVSIHKKVHVAQLILKACLGELISQISIQCTDRGDLLERVVNSLELILTLGPEKNPRMNKDLECKIQLITQEKQTEIDRLKENYKEKLRSLKGKLTENGLERDRISRENETLFVDLGMYKRRIEFLQNEAENYSRNLQLFKASPPQKKEEIIIQRKHASTLTTDSDFPVKTIYNQLLSPPLNRPLLLLGHFSSRNIFHKNSAYLESSNRTIIPSDFPMTTFFIPDTADACENTVQNITELNTENYVKLSPNAIREQTVQNTVPPAYYSFTALTGLFSLMLSSHAKRVDSIDTQFPELPPELSVSHTEQTPLSPVKPKRHKQKYMRKRPPPNIPTKATHLALTEQFNLIVFPQEPTRQVQSYSARNSLTESHPNSSANHSSQQLEWPCSRTPPPQFSISHQENTEISPKKLPEFRKKSPPLGRFTQVQPNTTEDAVFPSKVVFTLILDKSFQTDLAQESYSHREYNTPISEHSVLRENSGWRNSLMKPTHKNSPRTPHPQKPPYIPQKQYIRMPSTVLDAKPKPTDQASSLIADYLKSLSKQKKIHSPMPIRQLIKIINKVYSEALRLFKENSKGKLTSPSATLYDTLLKIYGLRPVAEQKLKHVILGCVAFSNEHIRVKQFELFLGITGNYTIEYWNFYVAYVEYITANTLRFNKETQLDFFAPYDKILSLIDWFFQKKLPEDRYLVLLEAIQTLRQEEAPQTLNKRLIENVNIDLAFTHISSALQFLFETASNYLELPNKPQFTHSEFTSLVSALSLSAEDSSQYFSQHSTAELLPYSSAVWYFIEYSLLPFN